MITNTDAGTADEETLDRALASLFDEVSIEVTATSNPGELDGVLHRRHDLSKAVIGLLPLGTGNDFARAMEIPLDAEEAARVLVDGEIRPVDLIVDELGGVVVNNVHVGAGAQASRRGWL